MAHKHKLTFSHDYAVAGRKLDGTDAGFTLRMGVLDVCKNCRDSTVCDMLYMANFGVGVVRRQEYELDHVKFVMAEGESMYNFVPECVITIQSGRTLGPLNIASTMFTKTCPLKTDMYTDICAEPKTFKCIVRSSTGVETEEQYDLGYAIPRCRDIMYDIKPDCTITIGKKRFDSKVFTRDNPLRIHTLTMVQAMASVQDISAVVGILPDKERKELYALTDTQALYGVPDCRGMSFEIKSCI